eukprot:TRINITY_DN3249_c0_g1_i13.p1 TRINITY_DN3249_c0_g1~~TRINITY_DN3249_c0_g1_i13.p1  ORF type:complete len:744 (+),score=83.39 TRINITY_DN3249_c0_g1_i13:96-2327(+)
MDYQVFSKNHYCHLQCTVYWRKQKLTKTLCLLFLQHLQTTKNKDVSYCILRYCQNKTIPQEVFQQFHGTRRKVEGEQEEEEGGQLRSTIQLNCYYQIILITTIKKVGSDVVGVVLMSTGMKFDEFVSQLDTTINKSIESSKQILQHKLHSLHAQTSQIVAKADKGDNEIQYQGGNNKITQDLIINNQQCNQQQQQQYYDNVNKQSEIMQVGNEQFETQSKRKQQQQKQQQYQQLDQDEIIDKKQKQLQKQKKNNKKNCNYNNFEQQSQPQQQIDLIDTGYETSENGHADTNSSSPTILQNTNGINFIISSKNEKGVEEGDEDCVVNFSTASSSSTSNSQNHLDTTDASEINLAVPTPSKIGNQGRYQQPQNTQQIQHFQNMNYRGLQTNGYSRVEQQQPVQNLPHTANTPMDKVIQDGEPQLCDNRMQIESQDSISDVERFLIQIMPSIEIDRSSQDSISNIRLADLWKFYEQPSYYGREIFSLGGSRGPSQAYYVPFLSAIQLFVPSDNENNEKAQYQCDSPPIGFSSNMNMLFEFFETDLPHQRPAMFQQLQRISLGLHKRHTNGTKSKLIPFPQIMDFRIGDLHPSSWFAVAWYPIYRVPDAPLSARFLTYHCLYQAIGAIKHYEDCSLSETQTLTNFPMILLAPHGFKSSNIIDEKWFATSESLKEGTSSSKRNEQQSFGESSNRNTIRQKDQVREYFDNLESVAYKFANGEGIKVRGKNGFENVRQGHKDFDFFSIRG